MKSLDGLLSKGYTEYFSSFKELKDEYDRVTSNNEEYSKKKENMEKEASVEGGLTLAEAYGIYSILGIVKNRLNVSQDVIELRNKLVKTIPNMSEYILTLKIINDSKKIQNSILENEIDFNQFGSDDCDEHHFIRLNDELVCAKCMSSSKDYIATQSDVEFLTLCAKEKGKFLQGVEEQDIPLYKVLLERQYDILDKMDKPDPDYSENKYLTEEGMLAHICNEIKIAKMMDSGEYEINKFRTINPKYLSDEAVVKLLAKIQETIQEINNSDSRQKDLLLEMCEVAINEVLILRGHTISELMSIKTSEEELFALAKAYYNISNYDYKINDDYFDNLKDAINYKCLTANPKINQKVLDMKVKRS